MINEPSKTFIVVLTEDDDGVVILKSGARHPSHRMLMWLRSVCVGRYRFHCDDSFRLLFEFDDPLDALRFEAAWKQAFR